MKMLDISLSDQERTSLMSLLWSYQDLFDFNGRLLTRTSLVYHHINTADARPV